MDTTVLNNGVAMPLVGFGTYQITDPAECERSVETAIEAGYRLIDTAQNYGNERSVGAAVRAAGVPRSELFITSKVWFRNHAGGECGKSVYRSLERLGLDYLDLMLIHWPFGDVYAAWRDLERLYKEGVLRAIGVSNFSPDRLIDLINYNEVAPAVDQVETHLYCQQKTAHEWMARYNVVHQAYAPLGQSRINDMFALPAVRAAARAHGKTPAQVALRFMTQQGISVIPKSVHPERIRENIDIFDFELTAGEMAELSRADNAAPMIGTATDPKRVESAKDWKSREL